MAEYGLGTPAFAAFNTPTGPKIHTNGEPMDVKWMEENWVLVWFAGASGWTNWDSPWVIYLQHKPTGMSLDKNGLHFEFTSDAGDVVLFPLYGYEKAPLKGKDYLAAHGLPSNKIRTWEWERAIPREPLMRVKYWACATREFPIYCEDSFSVNRASDTLTIRQHFQWHSIHDDWKTRHIKLAPISPPLAFAFMDKQFPVEFSEPVRDFALFTPYGPYLAAENVDGFDATFKLLQYINETEAYDAPQTTNHPTVQAALDRLRTTAREKFHGPEYAQQDERTGSVCQALSGDLWFAKALPYYEAVTRTNALASLGKHFREEVLIPSRFILRDLPAGSGRSYYVLEKPGIEQAGMSGDFRQFNASLLETLWAHAHFTGDWDLLKQRWDLVKKLRCTPAEASWVSFGCEPTAELCDQAAPCLAMARMAYRIGDIDTYNYACCMFVRELVQVYAKQRGADYFRRHQPWHSMEFLPGEVYLNSIRGDVAGWQIDGPSYPAETQERQWTNRWVRFNNEDVARFYRDYLKDDVRRELDVFSRRWEAKRKYDHDPNLMPSEVQLRSFLLNASPAQLATVATPQQFSGPAAGVVASCISVLRTSHPTRYERLIPAGDPSPFVAGPEREVAGPNPCLVQAIQSKLDDTVNQSPQPIWPEVTWWKSWKTPTGHRWTFGHVTPLRQGTPTAVQAVPLNWNTEVFTYRLP